MLDNVESKYIVKEIFENINNKRKLNIIEYNKRIKIKLDIDNKDFEIYITLKEFNDKYKINIEDIDIKELILDGEYIGNEVLNELGKINFKELKILFLDNNNISNIKVLEKVKFEKLEVLYLSRNEISDINILEKVNFKELKELYLGNNKISDIEVLEKVKFEKLEVLGLSGNEIDLTKNNSIILKLKSLFKRLII